VNKTNQLSASLTNPLAEWELVSHLIAHSDCIPEIVATQLQESDFGHDAPRAIFGALVAMHYAGTTITPSTVSERLSDRLTGLWRDDREPVSTKLAAHLVESPNPFESITPLAEVIQDLSIARSMVRLCEEGVTQLRKRELPPREAADSLSMGLQGLITGVESRRKIWDWMDGGTEYFKRLNVKIQAKRAGLPLGVLTGVDVLDEPTGGIEPGEVFFLAGDAGVGKSTLAQIAVEGFANSQLIYEESKRVGSLVVNLEMSLEASHRRTVETITHIQGKRLRTGDVSDQEWDHMRKVWIERQGMPLHQTFASSMKLSELRGLVVEAIRKHNVGFVVLDHFRLIDTDTPLPREETDEVKVRFIRENIAKDLNVAVMVLAHVIKINREGTDRRPRMSDLRGSNMINANADFIAFLHRPRLSFDEKTLREGTYSETDAEIVWAKNREGSGGVMEFYFDPATKVAKSKSLHATPETPSHFQPTLVNPGGEEEDVGDGLYSR
jgi:replicative DNA helicase